jgi:hypothetical protein
MSFMINKNEALKILKQHESDALKREVLRLFRQRQYVQLLSVDRLVDSLPTGGACYWTLTGKPEDYWYVPVPVPGPSVRLIPPDGKRSYYAISKKTGEVSGLTLYGE